MIDTKNKPYILLPFNFMRIDEGRILAVNMVGEYISLPYDDFISLVNYSLGGSTDIYGELKAKHFVTERLTDPAIDLLAIKYRTKKSNLDDFTALHMFVLTTRCNQKCIYCHASSRDTHYKNGDMNRLTAKRAVDMALMTPANKIKIEFQGGEPLLNYSVLKFIVEYARRLSATINKEVEFVVCTNLTAATDNMLKFFAGHDILISTSFDGPKHVHDNNRIFHDGSGSYDDLLKALEKARRYIKHDNISALMTTTRYSLPHPEEIVAAYIENGLSSIFVRSLNPFGYAKVRQSELSYSPQEFVTFYKRVLDAVIEINRKGTFISEGLAALFLSRILTPYSAGFVDMQFPTGAGISGVIYDYNGNVYLSDEGRMLARMGDEKFCQGNVETHSYRELFYGSMIVDIIRSTCSESLPECCDCAFQAYCGIDPIRNYAAQNDIVGHRPTSRFCYENREILRSIFDLVLSADRELMDIFLSWIVAGADVMYREN